MKQVADEDIQVILERIDKLSTRPDNPGMAYRNLEMIHALAETLRKKIGGETGRNVPG